MSVWLIAFNLTILMDLLFSSSCSCFLMSRCPPSSFRFLPYFSVFPSRPLPHSSCWSHCCPRWWRTEKTETLSEGQRGTEGFIKPWRAGRFWILWLAPDRRHTDPGGGLAPKTSRMSRRRSTGDLVPRDITEILAREARAQRGQKKPGSSLGHAFSWLKGSRKKKSIANGMKQTGIGVMDAKMGLQNHEPAKGEWVKMLRWYLNLEFI